MSQAVTGTGCETFENFLAAGKLDFVRWVKESSLRRSEQHGVVCAALM